MHLLHKSVSKRVNFILSVGTNLKSFADKPERITIITSAAQNTAVYGQNVTITCHVTTANPSVSKYVFFLNGSSNKALHNTNHFTIHNVQRSHHHGKYKCEAQNDAEKGQSGEVFLKINGKSFSSTVRTKDSKIIYSVSFIIMRQ